MCLMPATHSIILVPLGTTIRLAQTGHGTRFWLAVLLIGFFTDFPDKIDNSFEIG